MFTGSGYVVLHLLQAGSLKEKRRIIKHILADLQLKFKVAAAEVDYQDKWQMCKIAFATVGAHPGDVEQFATRILNYLDDLDGIEVLERNLQII